MKRKFCIAVSIFFLFTGCGQQTELVETDAEIDVLEETELDNKIDAETVEETTIGDEAAVKYQELLANYEGTPYEKAQELNYIPRPRQLFNYQFFDTVTEIEEIGRLCDGWDDGTYVVVHFENEENNLFMYDKSRQGGKEWNPYISAEFDEYMSVIAEQENLNSFPNSLDGDTIPEIGTSDHFEKNVSIQNVVDTSIIYNDAHYYEVDSGNGLKNLVYVPLHYIPDSSFSLYELGEFQENAYYNKEYHIQIVSDLISPRNNNVHNTVFDVSFVNWHEELGVDPEDGYPTYFSIDTYEALDSVTEEIFNIAKMGLCPDTYYTEQGTDILGGKEYIRFEGEDIVRWLRYEDNKIYSISGGMSYEKTLPLISDYT